MGRPARYHREGGLYYLRLDSTGDQRIFNDDTERREFLRLFVESLHECDMRALAFCLLDDCARFAVQVNTIPIGKLVQRMCAPYTRWIRVKRGGSGRLFQRHRSVLVDRENVLLELVRCIHRSPIRSGLIAESADPADYAWSSHCAYLKQVKLRWVVTGIVFRKLHSLCENPLEAFVNFMRQPDHPRDVDLFEKGSNRDPRFAGNERFIASLLQPASMPPGLSIEQVRDYVASTLGYSFEKLQSDLSYRGITLARARFADFIIRNGIAPQAQVARWLRRAPSTICKSIAAHKRSKPHLFPEITPTIETLKANAGHPSLSAPTIARPVLPVGDSPFPESLSLPRTSRT